MQKLLKTMAILMSVMLVMVVMSACGNEDSKTTSSTPETTIEITLYSNYAPISCENFEKLVKDGYYDGLTFHRVVDDFMAQGGDPAYSDRSDVADTITGEFAANGIENNLSHTRGIVSMARAQDMNSASGQFFICYDDSCAFLDGNYAAFGEVTSGMDIVDKFTEVERSVGADNAVSFPNKQITIAKAQMIDDDENGNHRVEMTITIEK